MAETKVLVIEDEILHLDIIRSKLKSKGYFVLSATDGKSGFQTIRSEKPDLILLDLVLPKMDGFEVLEEMKKAGIKIPVIVVSNSGQPLEIARARNLGVEDFLVKAEFNPDDVLKKVAEVLKLKK